MSHLSVPPYIPPNVQTSYKQAQLSVSDRATEVRAVESSLQEGLELLCVTGVEDRLQENVRPTLELLRNAGIRVGGGVRE